MIHLLNICENMPTLKCHTMSESITPYLTLIFNFSQRQPYCKVSYHATKNHTMLVRVMHASRSHTMLQRVEPCYKDTYVHGKLYYILSLQVFVDQFIALLRFYCNVKPNPSTKEIAYFASSKIILFHIIQLASPQVVNSDI